MNGALIRESCTACKKETRVNQLFSSVQDNGLRSSWLIKEEFLSACCQTFLTLANPKLVNSFDVTDAIVQDWKRIEQEASQLEEETRGSSEAIAYYCFECLALEQQSSVCHRCRSFISDRNDMPICLLSESQWQNQCKSIVVDKARYLVQFTAIAESRIVHLERRFVDNMVHIFNEPCHRLALVLFQWCTHCWTGPHMHNRLTRYSGCGHWLDETFVDRFSHTINSRPSWISGYTCDCPSCHDHPEPLRYCVLCTTEHTCVCLQTNMCDPNTMALARRPCANPSVFRKECAEIYAITPCCKRPLCTNMLDQWQTTCSGATCTTVICRLCRTNGIVCAANTRLYCVACHSKRHSQCEYCGRRDQCEPCTCICTGCRILLCNRCIVQPCHDCDRNAGRCSGIVTGYCRTCIQTDWTYCGETDSGQCTAVAKRCENAIVDHIKYHTELYIIGKTYFHKQYSVLDDDKDKDQKDHNDNDRQDDAHNADETEDNPKGDNVYLGSCDYPGCIAQYQLSLPLSTKLGHEYSTRRIPNKQWYCHDHRVGYCILCQRFIGSITPPKVVSSMIAYSPLPPHNCTARLVELLSQPTHIGLRDVVNLILTYTTFLLNETTLHGQLQTTMRAVLKRYNQPSINVEMFVSWLQCWVCRSSVHTVPYWDYCGSSGCEEKCTITTTTFTPTADSTAHSTTTCTSPWVTCCMHTQSVESLKRYVHRSSPVEQSWCCGRWHCSKHTAKYCHKCELMFCNRCILTKCPHQNVFNSVHE